MAVAGSSLSSPPPTPCSRGATCQEGVLAPAPARRVLHVRHLAPSAPPAAFRPAEASLAPRAAAGRPCAEADRQPLQAGAPPPSCHHRHALLAPRPTSSPPSATTPPREALSGAPRRADPACRDRPACFTLNIGLAPHPPAPPARLRPYPRPRLRPTPARPPPRRVFPPPPFLSPRPPPHSLQASAKVAKNTTLYAPWRANSGFQAIATWGNALPAPSTRRRSA